MTALDMVAAGVRFDREGGELRVKLPPGRPDLLEALRCELARRVPTMAEPLRLDVPRAGACEACADPMAHYRNGWCELCALARRKALEVKRAAARKVAA